MENSVKLFLNCFQKNHNSSFCTKAQRVLKNPRRKNVGAVDFYPRQTARRHKKCVRILCKRHTLTIIFSGDILDFVGDGASTSLDKHYSQTIISSGERTPKSKPPSGREVSSAPAKQIYFRLRKSRMTEGECVTNRFAR